MTRPVIPYSTDTLPDWLQGDARKEKPFRAIGDTQRRVIAEVQVVGVGAMAFLGAVCVVAALLQWAFAL